MQYGYKVFFFFQKNEENVNKITNFHFSLAIKSFSKARWIALGI